MHLKDEIIKDTNRVEIVQTQLQRLESSRGLQDLLGREKDAIRTQHAARMLELEKELAEYREKYGVFPGGEKAAREVLLPKKSGENEKISQTVRTILETKATPEEMVPDIMELAMEGKYSCEEASREVVADACEMMLGNSTVVEQMAKENRSLAEKIRDWLREWVENLKIALEGLQADRTESRAMMQYAQELQEIWDKALVDAAQNNRGTVEKAAPAESRQSIRETSDGKKYVKADRQVLFGSDPDSWSEQLEDYINGKIRRGQDVQLIAEDGDVLLLTRTSAGKLSDNHTSDGRTMSDAAFERKANAAAHIDELVEVSSKGKKTIIDKDARHGDMASGGWNYRTAYFMDFDGKYYKTTISVAEGSGGSIVYSVGHMKEEAFPKIKGSYAEKGNGPRGNTSTNSIRQSNDNSQEKSSDNKNPTADPDIRYQQRDSDKIGDWDENGNPIFDNTPVRVEEATDFAEVKRRRKAAVEDYGLEKNESMRIESYVSGFAYELNKRMNSGILSEQDQNYADKVRDAFRKFPQYKGTTFWNLSFGSKKAFEEFLLGHKKGEVIKLKAFTSTSKSPNGYKVSGEFIVHMEFRGESNADISETYGLPRQQEVVYMPGTEIRVSDVTTANDGNPFIIVEEVGIRDQRANIGAEKPAGGMESNSENGRNFTGGENEFSDGVRGIERNRYVGNDALSERGKSDPGRSLTDSDVKNQQRESRLSDRDVLSLAADMALRQQNKSWTPEDRNRLEIFTVRLRRLEEAQAELKTLKQERKDLLDGRKASEVTKDERIELTQNKNRTDLAKKNVEKREAQLYEIESIEAVKTLLRKSREVVEKETAFKARQRYREKTEDRQRYQVLKKRLERTTNEWKRMLLKPTKDRYAPEELVRSCLEVALMLDESGRRLAGFGRNTENEILLPRNTRLVPYRMERVGPTSIRIYVREETISETGKTNDSALPGVLQVREGTQRGKDLQQVSGGDSGKVQSEMGRFAGRDGNRGGMPGLREGEGSRAMDPSGVAENYGRTGTRGGEGEGVKNQQREPRLSDRDVLRRAADLALNDRKMNFTQADRERLKIFKKRLDILDEKQTQRQGYLQAKRDILSNSARLF